MSSFIYSYIYLFYRWRACKQADSKKGWSYHRVTLSTWFAFNRKKGIIHGQYFVWLSSNCSQILWDQGHYLFLIYLQFLAERYLLKYLAGWKKILKLCTYVFNFISQRIFKNVAKHIRCPSLYTVFNSSVIQPITIHLFLGSIIQNQGFITRQLWNGLETDFIWI